MKNKILSTLFLSTLLTSCAAQQDSQISSLEEKINVSGKLVQIQNDYLMAIDKDALVESDIYTAALMVNLEGLRNEPSVNNIVTFSNKTTPEAFVLLENHVSIGRLFSSTMDLFGNCITLYNSLESSKIAAETKDMRVKKYAVEAIHKSWISVIATRNSLEKMLDTGTNKILVEQSLIFFDKIFNQTDIIRLSCFDKKFDDIDLSTSERATEIISAFNECVNAKDLLLNTKALAESLRNKFSSETALLDKEAGKAIFLLD